MDKGYYSIGLCGYEIWADPEDSDRMMARFVGTEPQTARSYKLQFTKAGRAFIRPYGMRIYMDLCLRV